MIARCLDRMRQTGCAGCERRDACADLLPSLWRSAGMFRRPKPRERPVPRPGQTSFLELLTQVAAAFEGAVRPPPKSEFRRAVEATIEPLLASGEIGVERVARALGCSRQTLYRRLKSEGTTFEEVLDAIRRRLALRFIRARVPVKEAAYRLGFSEPAAFSRAYKRWTGSSPTRSRGAAGAPIRRPSSIRSASR